MDNGSVCEFLGRDGYTQINNPCLRDSSLSLAAIGVLANLLSVAEWWKTSVSGLAALHSDGRTRVTTSLRQLEERGYVTKELVRDEQGAFGKISYVVSDKPMLEDPLVDGRVPANEFRRSNMYRIGYEGYTKIANAPFRDRTISFKAVGLLVLLFSLPSWWHLSVSSLEKMVSDGASSIKSCVRELESHGYLRRLRERRPDGTLANAIWVITAYPDDSEAQERKFGQERLLADDGTPLCAQPVVEKPVAGKPAADNPAADFEHNKQTGVNKPLLKSTPVGINHIPSSLSSRRRDLAAEKPAASMAPRPIRTLREDLYNRLAGMAVNRAGLAGEEGRQTRALWNEQVSIHGGELVIEAYKRYVADRNEKGQTRYIRRLSRWLDASKADGVFFWTQVVLSSGFERPKKQASSRPRHAAHSFPRAQFGEDSNEYIARVERKRAGYADMPNVPPGRVDLSPRDLSDLQVSKVFEETTPVPTSGPFADIAAGVPAREAFAAYFAGHAKTAKEVQDEAAREFGIEPVGRVGEKRAAKKPLRQPQNESNEGGMDEKTRGRRKLALEMMAEELGIDPSDDPSSYEDLARSMGFQDLVQGDGEREGDAE